MVKWRKVVKFRQSSETSVIYINGTETGEGAPVLAIIAVNIYN